MICRWVRRGGLVGVACLLACGGDDGGGAAGGAETDTTGTTTRADTTSDASVTGGTQSTSSADATTEMSNGTTDGSMTGTSGTAETGTTTGGMIDEGDFADAYRLVFVQSNADPSIVPVWVDVTVDGATPAEPLLEEVTGVPADWIVSPSRRWLAIDVVTASGDGWVVDTTALGQGGPVSWSWGLGLDLLYRLEFLPDEAGLALLGRQADAGLPGVYATTLGDNGPGAVVQVSPDLEQGSYLLAVQNDQVLFRTADDNLHMAPAEAVAGQWVHAVDIPADSDPTTMAWLAPNGSAAYLGNEAGWAVADLTGALPVTATPITLPPDQPGYRSYFMSEPRNRLVVFDLVGLPDTYPPFHYLALDGPTVSTPYAFPIPEGPDGIGAYRIALTADGTRAYVNGTTEGDERLSLYAVDLDAGGSPTITTLAGPEVDDVSVVRLALSADEQTVYYATLSREVKMVSVSGARPPVDIAPGFSWHIADQSPQIVESEDGRAVFFPGYDETTPGLFGVYRVGIANGQLTEPVLMGEPLLENEITNLFPAPDGGAVAYFAGNRLMFSMYDDGDPTHVQLSSDGYGAVFSNTPPRYVAAE